MRIAFILMDFPVKSETFVIRDIKSLKEHGEEVDVFTLAGPERPNDYDEIKINPGITVEQVGPLPRVALDFLFWVAFIIYTEKKFLDKLKLLYLLPRCLKIVNAITVNEYDIIHLYWGHYPSLVGLILKRRLSSAKVSLFLGAYDLEKKLTISKHMSVKADTRWTHAKGNLAKLERYGFPLGKPYNVNYRSLDITKIQRRYIERENRKYDFITVGRLIETKGIMEALRAFRELRLDEINFKYAIVGDGPLRAKCLSYIKENDLTENIDFYGHVSESTVFSLMQDSRNFILLSEKKGECLPNVIKEAMLSQCYILSGSSDCIEELIPNDKIGIIVQRFNHQEIVKYLKVFLKGETGQDISLQGALIQDKFEIQNSTKRYIREWRNIYAK